MGKLIIKAKDYNGFKNVKFLINERDLLLYNDNYKVIGPATLDKKKNVATLSNGKRYKVFSDGSIKRVKAKGWQRMKKLILYKGGSKQVKMPEDNHDFSQIEIDKIKTNNLNRLIIIN